MKKNISVFLSDKFMALKFSIHLDRRVFCNVLAIIVQIFEHLRFILSFDVSKTTGDVKYCRP